MLKHLSQALVVALLALGAVVAPPAVAPASACPGSGSVDEGGWAEVGGECPGGEEESDQPNPGGGSGGDPVCMYSEHVIPCVTDAGHWDGTCYVAIVDPPPAKDAPVWEGNEEGYIISCSLPPECLDGLEIDEGSGQGSHWCAPFTEWVAEPPEPAGVSPLELAQRLLAGMQMSMGEIGTTPPSTSERADSVGLVGVPIWLWVADPGESTTGPITRTASEGGLTVTGTGTLDRIEWTLADESGEVYRSVTCAGADAPGTPWSEAAGDGGRAGSPTCGFDGWDNTRSGRLTLTGTAYWTFEWSAGAVSGTLDVPPQVRSAELVMGEVQVVTQ